MEREQAVEVLKQIMQVCSFKSVVLNLHPNSNFSNGCQIEIELNDKQGHFCAKQIASENNLAIMRRGNLLIIYQPKEH